MAGTRLKFAWKVLSDLVIATAIIWALPLALGAAAAIVRFFF